MKEMNEMGVKCTKAEYEAPKSTVFELSPYSHLMQISQIGGGGSGGFDVKARFLPGNGDGLTGDMNFLLGL